MARVGGILCTLWIVSVIVFGLQQLLPGDPAVVLAGEDRSPETVAAIRALWKLDEPVVVQYGHWLGRVLQGDLGQSMRLNLSVAELLAQKLPVTLQLASMALLIAMAALGLLPVGPSLGAATTVLILGSKGVAQTAAAGALLTATGAVGALLFASWALLDRLRTRRRSVVDPARR